MSEAGNPDDTSGREQAGPRPVFTNGLHARAVPNGVPMSGFSPPNRVFASGLTALPVRSQRSTSIASNLPLSPQAPIHGSHNSTSARPLPPKRARSANTSSGDLGWQSWLQQRTEVINTRLKSRVERQFRKHGRRIARHPVQTLLIACLILTSLFYPAVGIYLWSSKGGPGVTRGDSRSVWRSLSTPLLDSFASSGRKHHNSLRDLRMIWDDAPDLRGLDARDADAYLGTMSHWHGHDSQDATRQTSGNKTTTNCRSVRVEHVFVTTEDVILGLGPRYGALHAPILRSAWALQRSIEAVIGGRMEVEGGSSDKLTCVRAPNTDDCLVLSPLSFWSLDKDTQQLAVDQDPTKAILQATRNRTEQGIPLTLSTTLAGRSHLFNQLPRADHLALTFFLEDDEGCLPEKHHKSREADANDQHKAWSTMLRNITGRQVGLLGSDWHNSKEVVLQFVPRHPEDSFPTQKVLLAVGYIAMVVWLTRGLFGIRNVHSPFGLAFTACVELVISMTVAISICALSGVRLTLIPWEILPFVIVVIGSENMFALTSAIISTPTSLTVSGRLAAGFEKVGLPIAITVLSDVFLMSVVALLVDVRAVREFCIFAIFALVVDFFMQMTLYATVLSIDMQRLELADLLSQDSRDVPSGQMTIADDESYHSDQASMGGQEDGGRAGRARRDAQANSLGTSAFIKMGCRAVWRARTARTATLSLLLAFMAGIYLYHGSGYTSSLSYPFSVQEDERAAWSSTSTTVAIPTEDLSVSGDMENAFDPYAHLDREDGLRADQPPAPWWHSSPSAAFWQALNPSDSSSIHVKVEPWTVVSLPSATRQNIGKRNFASWAIFRPRVRAIIWFFKLTILPIAGTTALLWVLLMYLLKDTELLDAQLNKLGSQDDDDVDADLTGTAGSQQLDAGSQLDVTLSVYSEGHRSDVVLFAQTSTFLVSIDIDTVLQVSRHSRKTLRPSTVVLNSLVRPPSAPSALAASARSDLIAVGHASGGLSLLSLSTLRLMRPMSSADNDNSSGAAGQPASRITHVVILPPGVGASPTDETRIVTFHRDGSIWQWTQGLRDAIRIVERQGDGVAWQAFEASQSASAGKDAAIVMSSSDGRFSVYQTSSDEPSVRVVMTARSTAGVVRSAALFQMRGRQAVQWLAVGTVLGRVAVYDIESGRQGTQVDLFGGPIAALRSVEAQARSQQAEEEEPVLLVALSSATASILSVGSSGRIGSPPSGQAMLPPPNGSEVRSSSLTPTKGPQTYQQQQDAFDFPVTQPPSGPPNGSLIRSDGRKVSLTKQSVDRSNERVSARSSAGSDIDKADASSVPMRSTLLSSIGLSLLADLDCRRGGADVVVSNGRTSVVGLRRRAMDVPEYLSNLDVASSRWEVFEMELDAHALVLASQAQQKILRDGDCRPWLRRSPLTLDDGRSSAARTGDESGKGSLGLIDLPGTSDSGEGGLTVAASMATAASSSTSSSSSQPSTLSFTRLGRVRAFYKHDTPAPARPTGAAIARRRAAVMVTYGNAIGVVQVQTNVARHVGETMADEAGFAGLRSSQQAPFSPDSLSRRKNL